MRENVHMATSSLRGHQIYFDGKLWRYRDTDESTADTWRSRSCGVCKEPDTKEGHDPCLGTIPNIMNACCGHGSPADAYIQFMGGLTLRGRAAAIFQQLTGWRGNVRAENY